MQTETPMALATSQIRAAEGSPRVAAQIRALRLLVDATDRTLARCEETHLVGAALVPDYLRDEARITFRQAMELLTPYQTTWAPGAAFDDLDGGELAVKTLIADIFRLQKAAMRVLIRLRTDAAGGAIA